LGSFHLSLIAMLTLFGIAVVVLAGFATFVLLIDARERKRDIERDRTGTSGELRWRQRKRSHLARRQPRPRQ
jgi:hypothetical protein